MKVNAITLGGVAAVWALAFAGSLGGMYFYTMKHLPPLPPAPESHEEVAQEVPIQGENGQLPPIENKSDVKAVIEELKTWRSDLDKQRVKLLQLDSDIQRREVLMKAEKSALDKEREKIVALQKELEGKVQSFEKRQIVIQKDQDQSLKEMTDVIGKMKPGEAVNLLRAYPDEQITRFFSYLPKKQLAKLLELWSKNHPDDRERLVRVTEELRKIVKQEVNDNNSTPPSP